MEQNQAVNTEKPVHLSFIEKFLGTGFFSGYSPYASGTVASAVALLFFFIPNFSDQYVIIPATVFLFVIGGFISEKMEKIHGQDPSIVTIDEIVGMWMSLWLVPLSIINISIAFFVFRILDILKPYPASVVDKKSGGWNIMLDDVIAAVYTNIIIQIALHLHF